MSTKTQNINLVKPDPSEFYDVAIVNANSDKIDNEITDAKAGSTARAFKVKSSTSDDDALNTKTANSKYLVKTLAGTIGVGIKREKNNDLTLAHFDGGLKGGIRIEDKAAKRIELDGTTVRLLDEGDNVANDQKAKATFLEKFGAQKATVKITAETASLKIGRGSNHAIGINIEDGKAERIKGDGSKVRLLDEAYSDDLKSKIVPIGTIIDFAGVHAPTGYLVLSDTTYLKTSYPDLYKAIGDVWGATGGRTPTTSDRFYIPPQTLGGFGLYSRGIGLKSGGVGTYKGDVFKEHHHITNAGTHGGVTARFGETGGQAKRERYQGDGSSNPMGYNTSSTGDKDETRPRSITVLKCIKF